jgi:ABC-type molybdenum transport system ATPase subunit/photorepair protein PhrA
MKNPKDKTIVEIVADAVHDGWSYAAYNVDDPRYQTQPEKKANRIALADASYRSLSEGEKEKDRVIARALIKAVYRAEKR